VRTVAALAFLLALTVGVYWKLTFSSQYTWLENPDQAFQIRPWLDFPARELHAGHLPLWDPNHYGGQTLIGQVVPGFANPFNWILFAMPLEDGHIPVKTLHWYWVLIHWVAAAFCFFLCRDLGAPTVPALLGACIYTFAGFMGHATTPQFLLSAVWLPIVFLFFARVWRGDRPVPSAALCGAAMGLSFLSGHHNVPIYTGVLLGFLWIAQIARSRRIAAAAVFALVCALVSAFQVLPAVEYGRQAIRWAGAPQAQHWNERIPYSVHAEHSIGANAIPGLAIPGTGVPAEAFVGISAVTLALLTAITRWKQPQVKLFAAIAIAGFVIALGRDTPVHRILYELIPMVEKARYPAMAIVICQLGIAALASHWRGLAIPLLVLSLIEILSFPVHLELRSRPESYEAMIASQHDIVDFLHRQPGWFRVEFDEERVPYNFGDLYSIEQFGGYLAAISERVVAVLGNEATPRKFGIRYRVAMEPSNPAQIEVFRSRSGLKVYRDPRIADPLWSIHQTPCDAPDQLQVISRIPDVSVFQASMSCPGLMVAGDNYFRGWRAYVDGRRVPVQEVDGVRAVALTAGSHRVEFRYRPASVYLGACLTIIGLILAAVITSRWNDRVSRERPLAAGHLR
jgi:hypothetical protein